MPVVRPRSDWPAGRVLRFEHRSKLLEGNPWQDPAVREVCVYVPHDYSELGKPLPALWDLAAYTNAGPGHLNWRNHGENLVSRLDRLIGSGKMDPAVVVIPDCYTSLGGNQYVDSPSVGSYASYLVRELIEFVESRVNVIGDRSGRAVFGKSSGGYGALYHAMVHPEAWGAAACHSGDMGFELLFAPGFPKVCSALTPLDGDAASFIASFWRKNRPGGRDFSVMMLLAMAASYDPDPDNPEKIRLPFDLHTCETDPERWRHWMAFDPLEMAPKHLDALHSLSGLFIDVGIYDQYNLQYGARRFHRMLDDNDVRHHYEEFEGTHSAIDWRLDESLPFLVDALKKGGKESN